MTDAVSDAMTDLWVQPSRSPTGSSRPTSVSMSASVSGVRRPITVAQRGCALFGWGLLAVGAIVVGCTLSPHPLDHQVVDVLGLDHTFVLGVIELATGSALLAAASSRTSATSLGIIVGIGMWMAGIVALAELATVERVLGAGGAHGCAAIAGGAVLVSASVLSVPDGRGGDARR